MTTNTTITLVEATNLIAAVGAQHTVLVQGEMGCGKSSMLTELKRRYPDHHPAYFDLTTKADIGDFMTPWVTNGKVDFKIGRAHV